MYAIVETGGKQYKVQAGDVFEVEKLETAPGKTVKLDKVLLYSKGKSVEIGKPYVKDASVVCEVVSQIKGEKVIAFKYRKVKDSRTKRGHRQKLTKLKVKEINV